ncbi:MAG TPA: hypothetical protein VGP25_12525 [Gemmatimonadaceae bacterium]|jgi:hypothetical protein|nr:hypothetical protein [Gemmatimonadaceae bacterium]
MIDDFLPETEPSGALVPPPRTPPTALATAAPLPPRLPSGAIASREGFFRDLVRSTLDSLDTLGDSIAGAIGLR